MLENKVLKYYVDFNSKQIPNNVPIYLSFKQQHEMKRNLLDSESEHIPGHRIEFDVIDNIAAMNIRNE